MAQDWHVRLAEALGPQAAGLLDGDSALFDVSVERLHLFGGSTVQLPTTGATAIVGANNAGKSTLLREIVNVITRSAGHPEPQRMLLQSLDLNTTGEPKDVVSWIGEHSSLVVTPQQISFQTSRGVTAHPTSISHSWTAERPAIGQIGQVVVHYSHAQDRFSFGGSAEMRDAVSDPAIHPIHQLQDSRALLDELSEITASVFGQRLTLDALGKTVHLRIGTLDVEAPPVDDISTEYRSAMAELPLLNEQGDGMRGFMGQLLPLVTSAFKIIALDEPEAFLHPPQAYGLGQQLGRLAIAGQIQVIVATHDRNILAGLLDSGVDVSVVRLQREGAVTHARQLDASKVAELWRDPVLKYTNVLDGLFHHAAVLAEAEADCAYYAAGLDVANGPGGQRRDLLFVPTGGKDGMPRVATSLTSVGVPVVATADLDLLNDHAKVSRLVEALGGAWTDDLARLWQESTRDLRASREPATLGDVRTALLAVLDGGDGEPFTPELQQQVSAQLRTRGPRWQPMKEYGTAAFKGSARVALTTLLDALDNLGVVLVKPGELERLAPEVAIGKGPEWLPAALAAGSHANNETQQHVARIRAAALVSRASRKPAAKR